VLCAVSCVSSSLLTLHPTHRAHSHSQQGIRVDLGVFDFSLDDSLTNFGTCEKVSDPSDYPSYTAKWSCGVKVRGAALCLPGVCVCWCMLMPDTLCSLLCPGNGGAGVLAFSARKANVLTSDTPQHTASRCHPSHRSCHRCPEGRTGRLFDQHHGANQRPGSSCARHHTGRHSRPGCRSAAIPFPSHPGCVCDGPSRSARRSHPG
jgi:hypothetical protein